MNSFALDQLFSGPSAPDLGPGPRPGVEPVAALNARLERMFADVALDQERCELIRALVLLWHDHHEPAHEIVQNMETRDASYIHAILHRREPDYFNAKYWIRRVGLHPCFAELASRAREILTRSNPGNLSKRLLPGGRWDALAFVDACEELASPSAPAHQALREIQQAEFEVLGNYLATGSN